MIHQDLPLELCRLTRFLVFVRLTESLFDFWAYNQIFSSSVVSVGLTN
jgi:hypothetical protein